ncbi:MAG: arsenite efflux transporter metallochaperone ArsD [Ignavibacteriales bacterium]
MRKMKIFEPAMCCSTGLCGVGVDPELIRISTIINNLSKMGVIVERYNLSSSPQAFVNNKAVNEFINKNGVDRLPIIVVDEKIVIEGRYPSNEEISNLLGVSFNVTSSILPEKNKGCCGGGGCC